VTTGRTMRQRASSMRRTMTASERRTAALLTGLAIPFRAQVVCGPYIADFIGLDRNFVLEIDGPSHEGQRDYDAKRDAFFTAVGFQVIRIANADVSRSAVDVALSACTPWTKRAALAHIWMASLLVRYWSPGDSVGALKRLHCGVSDPRAD